MFRSHSLPIAKQVVIAAIVGTSGGAVAGLLSVAQRPRVAPPAAVQAPSKTVVTKSSATTPAERSASAPAVPRDAASVTSPVPAAAAAAKVGSPVAAATKASASVPAAVPEGVDGGDVLPRARALAQRPDVKALVALRESVVRRAAERGDSESAASKQQLDELDRYLEQARLLRLKLDAEEFKHTEAAAGRPR
jgi:hypothetical protein